MYAFIPKAAITCYSLDKPDVAYPKLRSQFYSEQIELSQQGKKPTEAVAIVQIMIFDQKGELFVQKRSSFKKHNPGLLDKTIGGHITFGDTVEYTAMVETVQELQIPSIVTKDMNDFVKTHSLLKPYLNNLSILVPVTECFGKDLTLAKVINGSKVQVIIKLICFLGCTPALSAQLIKKPWGFFYTHWTS